MTKIKVTLGGVEREIKPLTLGQMKAVGIGAAKNSRPASDPAVIEANWYDSVFDVLAAAMSVSVEDIQKIEGVTLKELIEAQRAILDSCGLIKVKEDSVPPGEATGATG